MTRGDVRRETILRIAREAFLQDGYAATSMSSIAARLGGSKGTLYNYFRSKEELFAAFMREICMKEAEEVFGFDGDRDVTESLHELGVRFVNFVLSDIVSGVHRLVIGEGARFPELGRTFYEVGPERGHARLCACLKREMDAGRLRPADASRATDHFLDLAKAGLHQRRLWTGVEVTPAEIEAAVASAVEVFMAAYGPVAPTQRRSAPRRSPAQNR